MVHSFCSASRISAGIHGEHRLAESVLYDIEAVTARWVTGMFEASGVR
jgi:hypothetical protein